MLGIVADLSISQIRSSPQAKVFFADCCEREGLTPLQLMRWIRTRWGSMHDLVERMLDTKGVRFYSFLMSFCLLLFVYR